MNIHQQQLLNLLKELDAFCRKHEITYYCAGGTVIGAARHHGFIPWDDDIDVYMTRENFFKFDEALKEYGPDDRKLEYYEANHERRTPVARYHRDTDTMFCHFHLFGHSCGGSSLDVFILDPIPDDFEARNDYIAKLFAYSDLIAPVLVYSHRLPLSKFDIYDKYKKIADEQGVPRAIELISEEIFNYEPSECSSYCLRWGSVILIYPIDVIGEPTYLPFEDMQIPVPHDWYRYLVIHYGMDWVNLPYEEVQRDHLNIVRYDMKYDYFYDKRDSLYDQDELIDLHFKWKDAMREYMRSEEPINSFLLETQNKICRANIEKRRNCLLDATGAKSLEELFDASKYGEIEEVFSPYIKLQTSHAYMGSMMMHGRQFRWRFPLFVPLEEEERRILFESMLRNGKQRALEKLVGVFSRGGVSSDAIDDAEKKIDLINTVRRAYYLGNYNEALELIAGADYSAEITTLEDFKWLCLVQGDVTDEQYRELEAAVEDPSSSDALRKAWGDLLWNKGEHGKAEEVYRKLMKDCRNGLFWMDIQHKVPDIEPIPTKRLTPFTETEITNKQRMLLEEIAELCRKEDIKYVLSPDLARRIYLTGNIGYDNSNREIFMDAANAEKFINAFKKMNRDDRNLLSWNEGDKIRDFALIYSDKNNAYCDFRRLGQWRDMGIFIRIRILRNADAPESHQKKALLGEFCTNLTDMEKIDKHNLQSTKKKLAHFALNILPEGYRKHIKQRTFTRNLKDEKDDCSGNYYYFTNVRGMKPTRHRFKRSLWTDTNEIEMKGVKYTIPASMTVKYVPHETNLENVAPVNNIFIYNSDEMTWSEISPLIDEKGYSALDWEKYSSDRRIARKLDKEVIRVWNMVLKLGEELEINEKASETAKEYRKAAQNGDEEAMGKAINQVDVTVKKYAALEVPIELEEGLRDCYEDYLSRTGQKRFIEIIKKLPKC